MGRPKFLGMNTPSTDPIITIDAWIKEAAEKDEIEPTACAFATATKDGKPSVRILLYKGTHDGELAFVTNYESRKANDITDNPYVALSFYWKTTIKQIRVEGTIRKASDIFSDAYWKTRPRQSQLSGWASPQSRPVSSSSDLAKRLDEYQKKFEGKDVPRPSNWGAYFVRPQVVELWIGQQYRLHDRTRYVRHNDSWITEILGP